MTPLEWAWLVIGLLAMALLGVFAALFQGARFIKKALDDVMGSNDWWRRR